MIEIIENVSEGIYFIHESETKIVEFTNASDAVDYAESLTETGDYIIIPMLDVEL